MLSSAEWSWWRGHIEQVVETDGYWAGVLNGEGEPFLELGAAEFDLSTQNLDATEGTLSVPVVEDGEVHPLVREFFGAGFGTDAGTILEPGESKGLMLCVQHPGGIEGRHVSFIEYPTVEPGADGEPEKLTFNTMELLGVLNFRLGVSIPDTWGAQPFKDWSQDEGGAYRVKRSLSPVELATTSWMLTTGAKQAGDVSVEINYSGDAVERVASVIQDSLDAADKLDGAGQAFVVTSEGVGPRVRIAKRDQTLWDTVAQTARLAGVGLSARMWWPGDDPVAVHRGKSATFSGAMGVIRVVEAGERA